MKKKGEPKKSRRVRICFKYGCRRQIKPGAQYCSRECEQAAKQTA